MLSRESSQSPIALTNNIMAAEYAGHIVKFAMRLLSIMAYKWRLLGKFRPHFNGRIQERNNPIILNLYETPSGKSHDSHPFQVPNSSVSV